MANIDSVTLEVTDPSTARSFYDAAFGLSNSGLGERLRLRAGETPTTGFRGYHISLIASQPANVNALFDAAVTAGATTLKPVAKSLWGHGGVVQAPDGSIWKLATSAKKDTAPASQEIDEIVLLIGVADVSASKRFYVEHGLKVGKSFGSYVDFDMGSSPIGFGLYKYRALAKDAGVPAEGTGSHRLTINGDLGEVSDPDGFAWEPVRATR
ncbi:VOC family protein [Myceligenerans pegani]|uniref:Glyoxalase n=1 Tax=Myceligenerans pegani TaxID=2776917 RepID=A0ABR9N1S3_9MICO|nr:VOC family protein [Myceligenerans sp. TRM 65318]MBE1877610.1 glyoxalase [Myceligenerans sp. TRM 65318]MBE3019881.1 glyoxalase [Myceligenerans sp. TRM 65318]